MSAYMQGCVHVCTPVHRFFWWELLLLARRFVFCVIAVLLQQHPQLQLLCGSCFALVCTVAQIFAHPFQNRSLDILDSLSMLVIFVYITVGIVFLDRRLSTTNWILYNVLGYMLVAVVSLTTVCGVAIFYIDVRGAHSTVSIQKAVKHSLFRAALALSDKLKRIMAAEKRHLEARVARHSTEVDLHCTGAGTAGGARDDTTSTDNAINNSICRAWLIDLDRDSGGTSFSHKLRAAGLSTHELSLLEILCSNTSEEDSKPTLGPVTVADIFFPLPSESRSNSSSVQSRSALLDSVMDSAKSVCNLGTKKSATKALQNAIDTVMADEELTAMLEPELLKRWVGANQLDGSGDLSSHQAITTYLWVSSAGCTSDACCLTHRKLTSNANLGGQQSAPIYFRQCSHFSICSESTHACTHMCVCVYACTLVRSTIM